MASILKNQLVKHLSKFTKNLKPEQISMDVLRGNGKLQFIEINEDVLTEILELPEWLKIKKAFCTGVTINVPWTKLKTCPIQIFIDEISVEVELSSEHKRAAKTNPLGNLAENNSYGFINKIVENMSLYINTVEINFNSDVFGGSFMLQRLSLESRSPGWAQVKDLRQTRISCPVTNNTLIYKQLSWHLLRIEASAKTSREEQRSKINAPLRLITSGGKIRIALKKNSNDGSVIHARIQTILDDILWVATLPQLRSAISFASYIADLVQNSQRHTANNPFTSTDGMLQKNQQPSNREPTTPSSTFTVFNFGQTSYHLHVKKIDLHLCDDANSTSDYPPNWDIESGAMQVTLYQVLIDVYPKSQAVSDRSTWLRYQNSNPISAWTKKHLAEELNRIRNSSEDATMKTRIGRCWPQMIGFFAVIRIYDVTVQCVSDMNTKKDALTNLFQSERNLRFLPNDQQIVHIEFASFYHPLSETLPVPKSAIYFQLGPFSLTFDERTARWCCYVANILQSAIEDGKLIPERDQEAIPPVIKLELIMPRIVINLQPLENDPRFPTRLVTSMSTIFLSSNPMDFSENASFRSLKDTVGNKNDHCNELLSREKATFEVSSSPIWMETDYGAHTKGLPFLNDVSLLARCSQQNDEIHFLVEPVDSIALILDHFQLLQLIRLGERLDKFFDLLSKDMNHYEEKKSMSNTLVTFLVDVSNVNLNLVLTMGDVPSPYDQRLSSMNGRYDSSEKLSDIISTKSISDLRSATYSRDARTLEKKATIVERQIVFEEFPEFPKNDFNNDTSPMLDDAASIATSIGDEATFDYEDLPNDDPFGPPDLAEEATTIDENATNDRIYRATMANKGNLLRVKLESTKLLGKLSQGHLNINGKVKRVHLDQQLAIDRYGIVDMTRKSNMEKPMEVTEDGHNASFDFTSTMGCKTSYLTVGVNHLKAAIDDEILTHLSHFTKNDASVDNNLRLVVNVHESDIQVVDRKKSKPLKLRIKSLTLEQEED